MICRLFPILLLALAGPPLASGAEPVSFRNDILPMLHRQGCVSGACHAKAEGQNNFKLTVFSYDPAADYHEIAQEDRGRRIVTGAPDQSLLLLKASGGVPHEGGARISPGSPAYQLIRTWISQGAQFSTPNEPSLLNISVDPVARTYQKGSQHPLSVTAHYSNGSTRDVTAVALFNTQDEGMAKVDENGIVTAGTTPGEGVISVRYFDLVGLSRVTVPPEKLLPHDRYASLRMANEIDRLATKRHESLGLIRSEPCSDAEFLRRSSLDTLGLLPDPAQSRSFLADTSPDKREKFIDAMLSRDVEWADHWATKWGDLIRPNTQHVGVKAVFVLDQWLRQQFRENRPYDAFVRDLVTATGSTHDFGPATLFRDKREPADLAQYFSRVFLGVRLDCARCHHHPSEKWTQDDYYGFAAFFGSIKRKGTGISAPISGDAEYIYSAPGKGVEHPVTKVVMPPKPPETPAPTIPEGEDPREALADWMTAPDNPFLARAAVNRIWGEFFGRGIVDPVDDFRASNPATNQELLDWLAKDFVAHQFDLKHLVRTILLSETYQTSSLPNESNLADVRDFSRSYRRRLPAESMHDAVAAVTKVPTKFQGLLDGRSSSAGWTYKINSEFLDAFARPNSSADCPCERDRNGSVVQALHLMNAEGLQKKLTDPKGWASHLAASNLTPEAIIEDVYLSAFCRLPELDEKQAGLAVFNREGATRQTGTEDLIWSLVNTAEFVLNH